MTTSSLFEQALSSLEEGTRTKYKEWERWAEAILDGHPDFGPQIVENLRTENHMVGKRDGDNSEVFANFLQAIASNRSGSGPREKYKEVSNDFELEGRAIQAPPPESLSRFVEKDGFLNRVARVRGGQRTYTENKEGFYNFLRIQFQEMGATIFKGALLGKKGKKSVFATFNVPDLLRQDRNALCAWTGRKPPVEDTLLELVYLPRSVAPLHFPTVADAGWYSYFRPAGRSDAYGWALDIKKGRRGAPEIVHRNRSADCVTEFPGEIP